MDRVGNLRLYFGGSSQQIAYITTVTFSEVLTFSFVSFVGSSGGFEYRRCRLSPRGRSVCEKIFFDGVLQFFYTDSN